MQTEELTPAPQGPPQVVVPGLKFAHRVHTEHEAVMVLEQELAHPRGHATLPQSEFDPVLRSLRLLWGHHTGPIDLVAPMIPSTAELTPGDPLRYLPRYFAMVERRTVAGRSEYGDRSFSRNPADLITEIEEELADVSGWAFVLFARLERLREAMTEQPAVSDPGDHWATLDRCARALDGLRDGNGVKR